MKETDILFFDLPLRPDHKEKRLGNYKNEIINKPSDLKLILPLLGRHRNRISL
jgi:hypothetical protein